jgi:thiamine transporter
MSRSTRSHLRIQALCEGAILLALAIVFNYLSKMIFVNMPQGGSVSLAMFPLLLYIHRWGVGKGLLIGFAYGLLDMLIDGGYAWGWQSMVLDYMVAYTALGLGGFFRGKAWGIFPGTVVGCLGRFFVHYLSGVTIYRIIEPTSIPGFGTYDNPHLYSLVYNGAYMVPNTLLALALAENKGEALRWLLAAQGTTVEEYVAAIRAQAEGK